MNFSHQARVGLLSISAFVFIGSNLFAQDEKHPVRVVTPEEKAAIEAALPKALPAPVKKDHKILVLSQSKGYYHTSTALGKVFFGLVQDKLKGFTFVFSDDQNDYKYDNLKQYDAIIFNNGTSIHTVITDPEIQQGIIRFVQEGGGAMAIHAASDGGWEDYNIMLGNRFAGHPWGGGEEHPFIVEDGTSPLTSSFGGPTFKHKDEIYVSRDPYFSRDKIRVLVSMDLSDPITASKPEGNTNRSDKDYSVSQVQRFGKGRVFYTSLGHNEADFSNTMILNHYLAGLEYVTGDLAVDDSPVPFYDRLKKFSGPLYFEASLKLLQMAKKAEGDAGKNEMVALCSRLLNDKEATLESKRTAIEALSILGTPAAVQALTSALGSEKLAHGVLLALSHHLSPAAFGELCQKALPSLKEEEKVTLINAMGAAGPALAPLLLPYIQDPSDAVAAAAIEALARCGTLKEAAELQKIPDSSKHAVLRNQALIRIAGRSAKEGASLYEWLLNNKTSSPIIKEAALKGLVSSDAAKGKALVLQYLAGTDPAMALAAIQASVLLPGEDITQQLAAQAAKSSAGQARFMVYALANRKDAQVPVLLEKLLENADLKIPAIDVLGTAATSQQVPALVRCLVDSNPDVAKEAADALSRLRAPKVDEVIIEQLSSGSPEIQEALLKVCAKRQTAALAPAALKLCTSSSAAVVGEALKAVAMCGTKTEFVALCGLVPATPTDTKLRTAMGKLGARLHDEVLVANTLIEFGQKAKPEQREIFLQLLGSFRTPESMNFLIKQVGEGDAKLEYEAIKSLSKWDNAGPAQTLLGVCANGKNDTNKTLAFSGVAELVPKDPSLSPSAKFELLDKLLKLATNDQQKILALKGLAQVPHADVQTLADPLLSSPNKEVADAAKTAVSNSYLQLSRVNWVLQSNFNNNAQKLGNLVDQDYTTRWASEANMNKEGPMWITVDLGYEQAVKSVVLDATGSNSDYPRSYELYVSKTPDDFGAPVATGKGSTITDIQCDAKGRYVKIVQTGKEGSFWSIHELQINGLPQKAKTGPEIKGDTFKLSSEKNGNDLTKLTDGNVATGWSTGGNQKAGQNIVIDLGSEKRVSMIVLDRGSENSPFPDKLTIYSSNDLNSWGGNVAELEGSKEQKIDRIHLYPFNARYLKIEVSKDSNHPWEVRELKLFGVE